MGALREADRIGGVNGLAADILDSIEEGFYALDGRWRIAYANRRACEMWHVARDTVIGCNLWERFPELDGSLPGQRLREAVGTARVAEFESLSPVLGLWLHVRVCPIRGPLAGVFLRDIDQQKRAEQALGESEARFRRVFEQSPLGKAMAGTDFRFREVNPALCRMLGYSAHELTGMRFLDLVHPDDQENCRRKAVAIATGEVEQIQLEERFLRKSGEPLWVNVNVALVRDIDGRILYTLCIIENIDERKRMTEALRDSEQRFKLAQAAGEIGTWDHDLATGQVRWSPEQYRLLGLDPEGDAADPHGAWLRILHPEDRETAAQRAREQRNCTEPFTKEFRILRGDGVRWILSRGTNIRDARGGVVRSLGVDIDITDRKRAEHELRELNERLERLVGERARQLHASRARLRAFFENSPDLLVLLRATADGRFLYEDLNPACERAYGLPRDQAIGRGLAEVLGDEPARIPMHYARECLRTGMPQRYGAQRTVAGQTCSVDVMLVLVPGEADGNDRFIIATARDVTEREELEAQLRHAQKMEAVGQLTGGVAHDFNNLLTAVASSVELIRMKTAEERTRKLADTALRAAMRGGQLTQQLLSFARRQVLQPSVVDLNALLRETEPLLRRAVDETIELSLDTSPDLWSCEVDPAQFVAAVMNLVVNARDAMPNGGRLVLATADAVVGADACGLDMPVGDYIVLTVRDTGQGMTQPVRARAFEPFFTTKEVGKGSGLGLSMVHGFARQSGGTARIESTPEAGTTVRLYLPRARQEASGAAATEPGLAGLPRSSGTILVVEDNEDVLRATVDLLRALNHRVFVAGSGPQALEVISRGEAVNLLLSDIVMPAGMNGLELARRARRLRPSLKVLLTSGYAAEGFAGAGRDSEFPFLAKPYPPAELGRRIGELLRPAPA